MATVLGQVEGSYKVTEKVKDAGSGNMRTRTFSIEYDVISDSLEEKWTEALSNLELPQIGSKVDECTCKECELDETNTVIVNGKKRFKWRLKYSFDSEAVSGGIGGETGGEKKEPTEWPVELSWSCYPVKDTMHRDMSSTSKLIANSSGQPMPVEIEWAAPCLTLTRYEPYVWGPSRVQTLAKSVNSDDFLGYGPRQCLIDDVSATREKINGKYYFKVTYKILFGMVGQQPWDINILDHGTRCRETNYGPIKDVCEVYGTATTINLDGYGKKLADGEAPVTLIFNKYPEISFQKFILWIQKSEIPEEQTEIPEVDEFEGDD